MPKKLVKAKSVKSTGGDNLSSKVVNPEENSPRRLYKTRGVAEAIKKT